MGDFKKNPKKPYEIRVPNKIRKRIAMHEKDHCISVIPGLRLPSKIKVLLTPKQETKPKRGSLWSRFINRGKKFLRG